MSQEIPDNDYQEPSFHVEWKANEQLNLTENFEVTIPDVPGTLAVYRVPDFIHMRICNATIISIT